MSTPIPTDPYGLYVHVYNDWISRVDIDTEAARRAAVEAVVRLVKSGDNHTADTERLFFVCNEMDGIGDHDYHELAWHFAEKHGRKEAIPADYLEAYRRAIDLTRAQERREPQSERE